MLCRCKCSSVNSCFTSHTPSFQRGSIRVGASNLAKFADGSAVLIAITVVDIETYRLSLCCTKSSARRHVEPTLMDKIDAERSSGQCLLRASTCWHRACVGRLKCTIHRALALMGMRWSVQWQSAIFSSRSNRPDHCWCGRCVVILPDLVE